MPQLSALQFDLATRSVPVDPNQDWLDVRNGDELIVGGKRRTVVAVKVYRGDGAGNATPVVECGREWLAQGGEDCDSGDHSNA